MFIDIETVPVVQFFDDLDDRGKTLFHKKFRTKIEDLVKQNALIEKVHDIVYKQNVSLYAEFAKVFCVSVGYLDKDKLRMKTIIGRNEKEILTQLYEILLKARTLVAHNGKSFDFPFLLRRYVINGMQIPPVLNSIGRKPWDLPLEDTMEMWSATQWKYTCSLDLLAYTLGLPSPKDEIDGSMIAGLYYEPIPKDALVWEHEEQLFAKVSRYCEKDIFTLANCYFKIKGHPILKEEDILKV